MDLRSYMRLLIRRWPVFVIVTIVVGGLLGGASFLIKPVYTAETEVLFSPQTDSDSTTDERRLGALYVSERIANYAALVTSESVVEPVIRSLGLDMSVAELEDEISVEIPTGTTLLRISVTNDTATGAADIAGALAAELPTAVADVENAATVAASPVVTATIQPASPPTQRTSPNVRLNLIVAALLGLFAGLLVAVLVDNFDNRVRRGADVTPLGIPYLGGMRLVRGKRTAEMLVLETQPHEISAAYRRLGIDVLFRAGEAPVSILFTSVKAGAGKTTTAAAIAGALAESGNRVVYVDADVRGGRLAAQAGIPQTRGVTDLVAGRIGLDEAMFYWRPGKFTIMPCGGAAIDVSEMLAGERMQTLLIEMTELFDVIIIDAPPTTNASEAARFTQNFQNVVVVAEAIETKRTELLRGVKALQQAGAKVLGVILSRVSKDEEAAAAEDAEPQASDDENDD